MTTTAAENTNETTTHEKPAKPIKRPRGFAAMTPERRAQISRLGGKAAHEKGTAHQFSPDEARDAGRKGGIAYHKVRGRVAGQTKAPPTSQSDAEA